MTTEHQQYKRSCSVVISYWKTLTFRQLLLRPHFWQDHASGQWWDWKSSRKVTNQLRQQSTEWWQWALIDADIERHLTRIDSCILTFFIPRKYCIFETKRRTKIRCFCHQYPLLVHIAPGYSIVQYVPCGVATLISNKYF
jgi:hypothetical protein